jgi:hypothetical protein
VLAHPRNLVTCSATGWICADAREFGGLRIGIERWSTESYEANVGRPFVGALVIMLEGDSWRAGCPPYNCVGAFKGLSIGIVRLSEESYEANVGRPFVGALVIMLEGDSWRAGCPPYN